MNEEKEKPEVEVAPAVVEEPEAAPAEKAVAQKDYEKVLKAEATARRRAKELETKATTLESQLRAATEEKMAAEGKKDELLQAYKMRAEESEKKIAGFWDSFYAEKKKDAVRASALRAGLRKEAENDLDLVDMDGVEVEKTDQGRVIVHHADDVVENLKQTRPHWFSSKETPRVNTGGYGQKVTTNIEMFDDHMGMLRLKKENRSEYERLFPAYQKHLQKKRAG